LLKSLLEKVYRKNMFSTS